MKATILGIALLMSGTAIAQTTTDAGTMTDPDASAQTTTSSTTMDTTGQTATDMQSSSDMTASSSTMTDTSSTMTNTNAQSNMSSTTDMNNQSSMPMATNMAMPGRVVMPGNDNPEKDARGIAVISAPAIVPVGWNGVTGAAVGGPLVDPTTGAALSETEIDYPPCTASRTDNCVQAYTRR